MNKYEQLIESILNEDEQTARALFHDIVVAKSREIYESLMDEELGGNQAQGFVQDITHQDEQAQDMGLGEDDLEGGEIELGGDDMGGDDFGDEETFGDDGDMGGEEGEHSEITSKLDDLEAQLAELKSMLGGEEDGDMGDDMGDDDMGDDMGDEEGESDFDMGGDEETSGEDEMMEAGNPFAKSGSGKSGSGKSGSGMSGSGKSGSGKTEGYVRKTEAEIMKEYVDKIGEIYKGDMTSPSGKMAGAGTGEMGGQRGEQNTTSIPGPGADFGGTNANIVNGKGDNASPDGKAFTKPKNIYSKGETTMSNEKFQNAPGANAGKTGFKSKVPAGHGAEKKSGPEGKTTDGSVPVAKKSVQVQNTGRK
jgi:hypothetical protein